MYLYSLLVVTFSASAMVWHTGAYIYRTNPFPAQYLNIPRASSFSSFQWLLKKPRSLREALFSSTSIYIRVRAKGVYLLYSFFCYSLSRVFLCSVRPFGGSKSHETTTPCFTSVTRWWPLKNNENQSTTQGVFFCSLWNALCIQGEACWHKNNKCIT